MYAQNNSDFLSEMFFMEEAIVIEDPDRVIYTHDRGAMNNILSNTNSYTMGTGCLIKDIIPVEITAVPIEHDNGEMVIGWIHSNNHTTNPLSLSLPYRNIAGKAIAVFYAFQYYVFCLLPHLKQSRHK
ncbi:hypothetical protein [Morganella morganii]|uniref:hypothetical protein n=1 Tax=Morganella morganii TaxID=582 RepID=UPI001BDB1429|nr:hypothetical protein [Morganella morganii]ELT0455801.1 hypothetical protein [Morganella morganii]MBT0338494.1 hypothetical protein [Morganella morganii subsp. morganii]